jgi:hypothetical protein
MVVEQRNEVINCQLIKIWHAYCGVNYKFTRYAT